MQPPFCQQPREKVRVVSSVLCFCAVSFSSDLPPSRSLTLIKATMWSEDEHVEDVELMETCYDVVYESMEKSVQLAKSSSAAAADLQQLLVTRKKDSREILEKLLGLSEECEGDCAEVKGENEQMREEINSARKAELRLREDIDSVLAETKDRQQRFAQLDKDYRSCSSEKRQREDRAARRQLRLSLYKTILPVSFNQSEDGCVKGFVAGDKDIATFSFGNDAPPFSRTKQIWDMTQNVCAAH